jgi:hypothetical protein
LSFQYRECGSFAGPSVAHAIRCFEQVHPFGRRVARGDATRAVSEEILPILERHACGTQPAPERVLQFVHTHLRKTGRLLTATPCCSSCRYDRRDTQVRNLGAGRGHCRRPPSPPGSNPRFAPVIHPTLRTGVEALVVAARAWVGRAVTLAHTSPTGSTAQRP